MPKSLPVFLISAAILLRVDTLSAADPSLVISNVVKADRPKTRSKALDQLFNSKTPSEVASLLRQDSEVIALAAGWHRFLISLHGYGDALLELDELPQTERFAGFVEGRLSIELPPLWEAALRSASIHSDQLIANPDKDFRIYREEKGTGLAVRDGTRLIVDANTIRLARDDRSLQITKEEFGAITTGGVTHCDVTFIGDRCIVSTFLSGGFDYTIACFDAPTGRVIWKSNVWAAGRNVAHGVGSHVVECVAHRTVLYVFGAESSALYIEGFDLENGENRFRFCTKYFED